MKQLTYLHISTPALIRNQFYLNKRGDRTQSITELGKGAQSWYLSCYAGNNLVGSYGSTVVCENCPKLEGLGLWNSSLNATTL